MNISGLVYSNNDSVSTGPPNRGVMAPHMGGTYGMPHAGYEAYQQGGYFEPHQVPQYQQPVQQVEMMPQGGPQYHHPQGPFGLRHPQQHSQHSQHPPHPQQASHAIPQHTTHSQHPHGMGMGPTQHPPRMPPHHNMQQAQQAIPRRATPVQSVQGMQQVNGGRVGPQRANSGLSVNTQHLPSTHQSISYQYPPPQHQNQQQNPPSAPRQPGQAAALPQQASNGPARPQIHIPQSQPANVRPQVQQQNPVQQRPVSAQQQQSQVQSQPNPQSSLPSPPKSAPANQVEFNTDVDTLMKAIQAKKTVISEKNEENSPYSAKSQMSPLTPGFAGQQGPYGASYGPNGQYSPQVQLEDGKKQKARKRYSCHIEGCQKAFFQKTHLEIHIRAHNGEKPYLCKEPGCGQRFSQMGNLKTHQRRHTGEKPFECDKCHKRFAQRGNVRAHRIVHEGIKPFTCRLENCNKQFTQLGNLKSHQNKFHSASLRSLTERFAKVTETESMSRADRELFEYFAELYKNSNKGIKGRGKDRKIVGSKKPKVDEPNTHMDRNSQESSMSPSTSSVDHSGNGMQQANFEYGDVDDESSVGSPFEQQQQAQLLPPLRPQQHHAIHDGYGAREYYGGKM